jgi:hypothetical protein
VLPSRAGTIPGSCSFELHHSCWDHSNDEFMRYLVLVYMMHREEGGGSPQIKVDIQRRLIVHVTMHVIAPTTSHILLFTIRLWCQATYLIVDRLVLASLYYYCEIQQLFYIASNSKINEKEIWIEGLINLPQI